MCIRDSFQTSDPNNRVLADYLNGVDIVGGTGAFEGATGTISSFGAADPKLGHVSFRYEGPCASNRCRRPDPAAGSESAPSATADP